VLDKKILNTVFKYFLVDHSCNSLGVKLKIGMTRCSLGCSDFDFFHILRHNHPSLTP
jgi:hypothetical protein